MPFVSLFRTLPMSFRLFIAAGVLSLSTTAVTAAGAQVRTDTTLTLDRNATVEVVGRSGDITVTTGTDNRLRVRGESGAAIDVRGSARSVLVDAAGARTRGTSDLALTVPRGTTLLVRTQSGDITVRGTQADVEVRTTSGDVSIEDAARVRVDALSGDITVRRARDGARINATSGDVALTGIDGDIEVSGTSTSVTMREVSSRRVAVKVVSGEVDWSGPFQDNGRYEFNAHSGDVRLALPRDTRATFDVRTFNGELSTAGNLALTLVPDASSDRVTADSRDVTRDAARVRAVRDSLQRVLADSMRRDVRDRDRGRPGWERDFERSVERLVESVMRGVVVGMESLAVSLDGAASRGRSRRFTLGRDGGPLVTVSTFSGDIRVGTLDGGRRE